MKNVDKRKKEIKEYAINKINELVSFGNEIFDVEDLPKLKIVVSFDLRRNSSYGGWLHQTPSIDLAIPCFLYSNKKFREIFHEYEHYKNDKLIGNVRTRSWKKYIDLLVAHEVSHIYDEIIYITKNYRCSGKLNKIKKRFKNVPNDEYDWHGRIFMFIYRKMRRKIQK
jgi:hypothetical protein